MAEARFDPGGFYQFDLRDGSVRTKGGARVLVLSDTVAGQLVSAAVQSGDVAALVGLGNELGTVARGNLGGDPSKASVEQVVAHASAVVSLFGWGKLGFERWGRALVAELSNPPSLDDGGKAVGALLTGLISALGETPADCVPVGGDRFLIVSPETADAVRKWTAAGEGLGAIVGRLGVSS
jgi:hypothetical protein